jgi:hypothetical protein
MAVPKKLLLYQNNDGLIEVDGFADEITGDYFNTATVTATLVDINNFLGSGAGHTVPGFPLTLVHVTNSDGQYRGKVAYTVTATLPVGGYKMLFDSIQSGTQLHVEIPCSVAVRKS